MARKGYNIYKRKDGRWEGRYIIGRKSDGKPIYGYAYAYKFKDCKAILIEKKASYQKDASKVKVGSHTIMMKNFLEQWLNTVSILVKISTLTNYKNIVKKWIIPYFGTRDVDTIKRKDVQDFVFFLKNKGLSPGTVRNIYNMLCRIMKEAIRNEYISQTPCNDIKLPEKENKEIKILTIEEQKEIIKIAKQEKQYAPIILAFYTGLRVGEICALKWSDIDFKQETMHISRTLQRVQYKSDDGLKKTKIIEGSTKSRGSDRIIPITGELKEFLLELKNHSQSEYVFTCRGHALEPRILQYRYYSLLKKANVSTMNFHALRHTFVTRFMEIGIDTKTISELIGHASTRLTLDCYTHSLIDHKRAYMMRFQKVYRLSA